MDWDLPLGVLCGLLVGFGMYWLLVPNWYVALGTATVYTGVGYFYFAFDVSLREQAVQFDDRMDRLGYAIGLFGLSTSPLAFAHYYGQQDNVMFPFVVWYMGVVAFLFLLSKAQQQDGHTH